MSRLRECCTARDVVSAKGQGRVATDCVRRKGGKVVKPKRHEKDKERKDGKDLRSSGPPVSAAEGWVPRPGSRKVVPAMNNDP